MSNLPDPSQSNQSIPSVQVNPQDDSTSIPLVNDFPQNDNNTQPIISDATSNFNKEQQPVIQAEKTTFEEMMPEMELAPELTDIGIENISDQIILPPDMKKAGVQAVGPSQPVFNEPQVKLPISDDAVMQGKHAKIMSSFFWLYMWCVKQLKRAHLHLKNIGGKVVRERD